MEEEKKKDTQETMECVKEETEKIINDILEEGIQSHNVDFLYKVIDIHKDVANEEYWEDKKEVMNMRYSRGYSGRSYNEYGEGRYERGRRRDSRGRYMEGDSYHRRGRYQGHQMLDEMGEHYGNYVEGKEEHRRGNYGAKEDTMKSLEYMMESVVDFVEMLQEEAGTQEEMELIKHYTKKISEM